jgi:hypothetical protein
MFGYRASRVVSFGAGGAAAAIVALMVLAPAGLGITPLVYKAPFKGVVGKFMSIYVSGCATAKGSGAFSMTSGSGTAIAAATAKTCSGTLGGVNAQSYGSGDWGTNSAIKVVMPVTGTDNLTDSWSIAWASAGSYSHTGSCPIKSFAYGYTYVSSTYAYWDNYTGYSGSCSASVSAYGQVYTYLVDTTSGQYSYPLYTQQPLSVSMSASNYTSTGFTWYKDTSWSSSSGYSFYNGSYSNNYSAQYSHVGGVYCYGNTCPSSWSNSSSGPATSWINGTAFNHLHKYAFVFEIYASAYGSVSGWAHALSTTNMNLATLGNGAKLVSVTIV